MKAKKVCSEPGCPVLTDSGRCLEHRRQADRARGTRAERGYDAAFRAERRRWAPLVDAGGATCWRCGRPITPGEEWDLGHQDGTRIIRGPEHARSCNRSAAGRARHGLPPRGVGVDLDRP